MRCGSTARRAVRAGTLLGSIAICVGLGLFGVGHGGIRTTNLDTRFLYLAGKYWLAGLDAYVPARVLDVGPLGDVYGRYIMGYPPQAAPLSMLLAVDSMTVAGVLMDALNLAALAVLAWVAVATIEETVPPGASTAQRWYVPALVFGNLSTAFVLWMGQTTLIVAAALAVAWHCARRGRDVAAGCWLALATIKPTLAVFVVLWFALARRWRLLAAMTATVGVLALVPMVVLGGPLATLHAWLAGLAHYAAAPQNALDSRMVFSLRSLLHALGIAAPDVVVLGALATVALFRVRARLAERDLLGVLVGFGLVFTYAHGYDLAVLVVLIPAFWRHLRDRPSAAVAALGLFFAISFPNRWLEPLGSDVLLHARVALVLVALGWVVALDLAESAAAAQVDAGPAAADRWFPSTSRMP